MSLPRHYYIRDRGSCGFSCGADLEEYTNTRRDAELACEQHQERVVQDFLRNRFPTIDDRGTGDAVAAVAFALEDSEKAIREAYDRGKAHRTAELLLWLKERNAALADELEQGPVPTLLQRLTAFLEIP